MRFFQIACLICGIVVFMAGSVCAEQKALGGLSPDDALEYMLSAKDLVIVDVAAKRWYEREHFEDAVNIPIEELDSAQEDELYMKLPAGRPVILHCRRGMIVPSAYRRVRELRPDIAEISYIAGAPKFSEYNAQKELKAHD